MNRISLKVTGAQGQGVNSVGELCGKGLKRAGYCVFGYREYMSLIKGGYSSYQLDISNQKTESTDQNLDIAIGFNFQVFLRELKHIKPGGLIIHQSGDWKMPQEIKQEIESKNIKVLLLPTKEMLAELKAPPILSNILIATVAWNILEQNPEDLKSAVKQQYAHKGEKIIGLNIRAIDLATEFTARNASGAAVQLPVSDSQFKDHLFLTGSQAMGLGLIHAGCRVYTGYPMTPSSPLLTYIAAKQNDTGMVVKQAEDEITAAQMMTGASFMGARAATATSGGGFDLMTETLSLNGIIENPGVFILAQRPGPGTGLPTWTAQGDLLMAVNSAHGEFARIIIAPSGSDDVFYLMNEAFNYAEKFRTPAIVLYDKQLAEALYTQAPYDQKKTEIKRGPLITNPVKLKEVKASDYYKADTENGVTPRWLPGAEADTYCAQGDEHDEAGNVNETGPNARAQMEKRMRKHEALKKALPDPDLYTLTSNGLQKADPRSAAFDVLIISWGTNKGVVFDVLKEKNDQSIAYLHYTYLWPLKTDLLEKLAGKAKKTVLIECNYQGQLGKLIKMECGLDIDQKILKYDGRPFFYDELLEKIKNCHTESNCHPEPDEG